MNLARRGFRRLLQVLATVSLLATALAAGAQDGLGEVGLETAAGEIDAVAGEADELQVVKTRGGSAAPGERVLWSLEDPASGRLEAIDELTRAGSDGVAAGSARAGFTPAGPGRYGITVQTPVDAACSGSDCRMLSRRLVVVAASPMAHGGRGFDGTGALIVAGGAAATIALLNSGNDGDEAPGARLGIISGDGQAALAGNGLAAPLVVLAYQDGKPAAGAVILWSASGGAVLSAAQTTASSTGSASVSVVSVGPGPGPITITATMQNDPHASVAFTAYVNIASLDKISGDNQTTPVDTTTTAPLVVRTLLNGNPQAGVAVTWQIFGGGTLSGVTAVSDANGFAEAYVDVGPFPGSITVLVTRNDAPSASQSFTVNAVELRDIVIVSGDGQSAPQGQPATSALVVQTLDNSVADPGVTVLWSATGGAQLSSNSTTSDPGGFTQVNVTDMGFGLDPVQVTATRADVPSLSVTFTLNVDPSTLTPVGGDNQSGLVTTAAPQALDVQLLDGAGNPMAGQTVSWTVQGSDSTVSPTFSTTNATGIASTNLTFGQTPGSFTIEASAFSGGVTTTFNASATAPGAPTAVSGTGQTLDPNDVGADLVVDIGSATAGVPVTWTVISGLASVSPTQSFTDGAGHASTTPTIGDRPEEDVIIRATVPGGQFFDFLIQVTGDLIDTGTTVVSGNGQELAIGVASAPMVIKVVDTSNGNAVVSGATVHWSTTNGTMQNATTLTDVNGETSNTVTISSAGPAIVTADIMTVGTYDGSTVTFSHNGPLASVPNLPVNEASVAEALDAACTALAGGPVTPDQQDLVNQCNALAAASGSDPAAVGDALTAMLPDVAQTQTDSGKAAVGAQFENLNGRIVQLRSGAPIAKISFSGLNLAMSGGQMPLATLGSLLMNADPADAPVEDAGFAKWGFFVSGNIGRGESDPTNLTPKYDFDVNGITAGVDYRYSDALVLGVALGYTSQDTDLANQQGSVDTTGFSVSAYTTWYSRSEWYLDGVVTFSRNSYDHERRIQYVLPGSVVDQTAVASSDGTDVSATLTFGRDWQVRGWSYGAYARAQYNRMSFDGFSETVDSTLPGSGLALRVESRSVNGFSSIIGGKVAYAHSASWGVLVPQLEVEWQNDFQSDAEAFRGYFLDDPTGTPILVVGDDLDSNYFRVGLGLSMVLTQGRSGFVNYERIVGRSGISQDMLSLGFRWEF